MAPWDEPAFEARDAARRLERFDIELTEDAARWVSKLTELRQSRPEPPPSRHVAELIADGANPAGIDQAIAAFVGKQHRQQQHGQAENIVGQRALAAILTDRDRLHKELADIAEPLIERLHTAALIDESIRELTRQRRTDEAHLLAVADSDVVELHDCYELRNYYLTPRGAIWSTGWWDAGEWANPWDIGNGKADHDGGMWGQRRANIKAGGRMWFPTLEQAHAASTAHEPDMVEPIDPRRVSGVSFA